ncbi:MAG: MBL fold metallo-hydrolase [Treponema sp.]|nr:MBL fold metallo-hydrolase [Candidatus Treponema merdequi]
MKITILIDNNTKTKSLYKEWGLSVYVEYNDKKILLDSGASSKFLRNTKKLGIDISDVDFAVLSHAHYDHSNGMVPFFKNNKTAHFYLRENAKQKCYHEARIFHPYIGIKRGVLKKFSDRIQFLTGDFKMTDGVYLIPNKAKNLDKKAQAAHLMIKENGRFVYDRFEHEQSLVFETPKGLVIMNSCSHAGADNIITDIQNTFQDQKIYAMLGGFHLFCLSDSEIKSFAERLKSLGVEHIYTGHCTGEKAFKILHDTLGDKAVQLYSGLKIEI